MIKLVYGSIPGFIKALVKHPIAFVRATREARRRASALTPVIHELPYDIPIYQEGMPCCKSNEVYLRPTYLCESDAPEIIAMANKLGAFQKPDREYVEACFDFVKRKIDFTFFQLLIKPTNQFRQSGSTNQYSTINAYFKCCPNIPAINHF